MKNPRRNWDLFKRTILVLHLVASLLGSSTFETIRAQEIQVNIDSASAIHEQLIADTTIKVSELSFRNADLRDIFDALAKTYDLNLWIDEKVQGKTTLHLVNVSLSSVFEFLAEQNQLVYEKSGQRDGLII
jgi:type II secretory pathway component HofQ